MARISIQPNSGNAPRKLFLKNVTVALADGDVDFLTGNISETIHWEIAGERTVIGKEFYLKAITRHKLWKATELIIDKIITHGPGACVSGTFIGVDNSTFSLCDIYRFKGAGGTTIHSINTFLACQQLKDSEQSLYTE